MRCRNPAEIRGRRAQPGSCFLFFCFFLGGGLHLAKGTLALFIWRGLAREQSRGLCRDKSRGSQTKGGTELALEGASKASQAGMGEEQSQKQSGVVVGESSGGSAEDWDPAGDPRRSTAASLGPLQVCLRLGCWHVGFEGSKAPPARLGQLRRLFTLDEGDRCAAAHHSAPARCAALRPGSRLGHGHPGT